MRNYTFILLFIGILFQAVNAQPVFLKEIPKNSSQFISANGKAYFFSGDSLYVSDGTPSGTMLVKDLGERPNTYNYPFNRYKYLYDQNAEVNGSVIFRTNNSSGQSLWRSDGTAVNTIKIGSFESIELLYNHNSTLYLAIDDGIHGPEVWKLDASFHLSLVKDIFPGEVSGYPHNMTFYKNKLYFIYDDDIYFTDGTDAGTSLAVDLNKGVLNSLTAVDGFLFTNAKYYYDSNGDGYGIMDELIKSDGTTEGTVVLKQFEDPYGDTYNFHDFISFKGKLYFFNYLYSFEEDFWVSDGTKEGTTILESSVVIDGNLTDVLIANEHIVFYGYNQGYVYHLWVSDGTQAGTTSDLRIYSDFLTDVVPFKNLLFFSDHDGPSYMGSAEKREDNMQLMQSDLTLRNTRSVRKIFGSGDYSSTYSIVPAGNKIIFSTHNRYWYQNDTIPARLWAYDPFKPAANVPYFTVVDADTDKDIQWLKSKDTLWIKPGTNINIRYNNVTPAGSVKFMLEDTVRRVEGVAPYALAGDYSGNYSPWQEASPGTHKLKAIQYASNGSVQYTLNSEFVIMENIPNRAPVITTETEHVVVLPTDSIMLTAMIEDPDGDEFDWYWYRESGPNYPEEVYTGQNYTSKFTGLIAGEYIFSITATDEFNERSTVNVTVQEEPVTPEGMRIVLVNADTDTDIRDLLAQDTIVYNSSTDKITISAIPEETVGSIQLFLDGSLHHNENTPPYALQGDNNGDYTPWAATYGSHTLTVKSFTGSSGQGTLVESKTIQFVVKKAGDNPPPPPPTDAQVTFTLVNAITDQDIGPLTDGQTINLSELPTNKLNVRANSSLAGTKSVVFGFNGNSHYRTESAAPYALFGDNNGDYFEWNSAAGTHHLKATPYTGSGGSGTAGIPLEITFYIVDGTQAQTVSMKTYPNPVEERLSVSVEDFSSENVSILIHDENGGMMYSGQEKVENGKGNYDIDLNHLKMKPGLYFVRVRSVDTGEENVTKIIKR